MPNPEKDWSDEYATVPNYIIDALIAYRDKRRPTGGCLRTILANGPLFDVVGRADSEVGPALPAICKWVYNQLPSMAWGSDKAVDEWLSWEVTP